MNFVIASPTQAELNSAKTLIDNRVSCNSLTDNQLELIGEFIMEKQNPGQAHEDIDKMMGLVDGSAQDAQFHINLAQKMYCDYFTSGGMMNGYSGGMMNGYYNRGSGMMSDIYTSTDNPGIYNGMMNGYYNYSTRSGNNAGMMNGRVVSATVNGNQKIKANNDNKVETVSSGNNNNNNGLDIMGAYSGLYGQGYMMFFWIITVLMILMIIAIIFLVVRV